MLRLAAHESVTKIVLMFRVCNEMNLVQPESKVSAAEILGGVVNSAYHPPFSLRFCLR